jgi:hypothetical protein
MSETPAPSEMPAGTKSKFSDHPITVDPGDNSLDNILTALQKSFSRVSAGAAIVPGTDARSLITGPVNFTMTVKVHPQGDRLLYKPDGEIALNLSGVIHQDLRVRAAGEKTDK